MNNLQPLFIHDNVYQLMSYWTFSDVFQERGFISEPFHNGFGMQTIRGIKKPIFRAMELLSLLGSDVGYKVVGMNDVDTIEVFCLKNDSYSRK